MRTPGTLSSSSTTTDVAQYLVRTFCRQRSRLQYWPYYGHLSTAVWYSDTSISFASLTVTCVTTWGRQKDRIFAVGCQCRFCGLYQLPPSANVEIVWSYISYFSIIFPCRYYCLRTEFLWVSVPVFMHRIPVSPRGVINILQHLSLN